jgi:hypothetical protein
MGERSIISTGHPRSRVARAAAVAAAPALGAVVLLATVDMPDVPAVLQHVTGALGPWTYALVAALVFMETVAFVGLLMPGEVTLAVAGAAAAHGDVALAPMLAIVWTAGVLGDVTGFTLGRRLGWSPPARVGPRFGLDAARRGGSTRPSRAGAAARSCAGGSSASSARSQQERRAWPRVVSCASASPASACGA